MHHNYFNITQILFYSDALYYTILWWCLLLFCFLFLSFRFFKQTHTEMGLRFLDNQHNRCVLNCVRCTHFTSFFSLSIRTIPFNGMNDNETTATTTLKLLLLCCCCCCCVFFYILFIYYIMIHIFSLSLLKLDKMNAYCIIDIWFKSIHFNKSERCFCLWYCCQVFYFFDWLWKFLPLFCSTILLFFLYCISCQHQHSIWWNWFWFFFSI